ncbi:MAG: Glu/Leu/Phe/Val dehydrogenase [Saprospiraceae bacterium]|nr:Glu/Leu/Phe/Val dehydrogenase [Saprospiraceae bacterium]
MEKLDHFLEKRPFLIFEWKDEYSDAEAWLVINSLKGGASGGGTRMRQGLTKEEVVSLAKVMEVKFNVCGPPIGGAKSGINFNPSDPRKKEVLERWFQAVSPLLKAYYGTGGDLNVDEVRDVFPITESLGIFHPQEGVLSGHFGFDQWNKRKALENLDAGCKLSVKSDLYSPDLSNGAYTVADMITGYGVAESIIQYLQIFEGSEVAGKTCVVQGWGNVGSAAAYYLGQAGVKIIGILDRQFSLTKKEGLSFEEIRELFLKKEGNQLYSSDAKPSAEVLDYIWDWGPDIFIPAAASRIVTADQLDRLVNSGTKIVACGANVPFVEDQIIYGDTSRVYDQKLTIIPDFISNCGMARTFHFLMASKDLPTENEIFEDVAKTLGLALQKVKMQADENKGFFENALSVFVK